MLNLIGECKMHGQSIENGIQAPYQSSLLGLEKYCSSKEITAFRDIFAAEHSILEKENTAQYIRVYVTSSL